MRRALLAIACLVACAAGSARAQSTAAIRQVFKCVDTSTGLYHVCPGATADQSAYQQLGAAVASTMSIPSAAQLAQMQADVTSAKVAVQSLTPLAQGALPASALDTANGAAKLDAQKRLAYPVVGDVSGAAAATGRTVGALSSLVDSHTSAIAAKAAQSDLTAEANTARSAEQANASAAQAAQSAAAAAQTAAASALPASSLDSVNGAAKLDAQKRLAYPVIGDVSAATAATGRTVGALSSLVDGHTSAIATKAAQADLTAEASTARAAEQANAAAAQAAQTTATAAATPAQVQSTIAAKIGQSNGIAGLNAAGALAAPVDPATIQQTHNRSSPMTAKLADLLGDTVNVRSFASATSTGRVGGVVDTTTTSAVASGATTIPVAITSTATASLISSAKYIGIDGLGALPISSVSVSGSTATITLSSGVSAAIASGTAVSIAQQDDRPAFQAAGAALSSSNGVPGTLEVPADHYMIVGDEVVIPDGASMVEHGGVVAAHGSALAEATDSCGGCFWSGASGTVYAQAPTSMNANAFAILQNVKAPPGQQVNLLLLSGVLNYDGSAGGSPAAVVGEEVRTSVAPSIMQGLQFGYHAVMEWKPGQYGGSSLAELEYLNNSGCDSLGDLGDQGSCSDGNGGTASNPRYGLHIDALGNTSDTAGIVFGSWANVGWHIGMACTYSVLDWCVAAHYKYGAHYKPSDIDAGFDMHGRLLAVGGLISGGTTDPGATKGLVVTRDGNTANVPATAPASDIAAPSYGIVTSFLRAYLGAYFYGGALFLNGGADTTPTSRQWDASFGNWGVYTNYLFVRHPINNATMKTADLPSDCMAGQSVFVSDARNSGEAAGAGTGALAYCTTAGQWYANGSPVAN